MPTMQEIIARYEARPIKTVRRTALTPRGAAAVAGYRFVKALRELDAADRAATVALFADELVPTVDPAPIAAA